MQLPQLNSQPNNNLLKLRPRPRLTKIVMIEMTLILQLPVHNSAVLVAFKLAYSNKKRVQVIKLLHRIVKLLQTIIPTWRIQWNMSVVKIGPSVGKPSARPLRPQSNSMGIKKNAKEIGV